MLEKAYRLLGLDPDADGRTIEATYWRRVRELAKQRATNSEAADELEQVNWAYKTLVDRAQKGPSVRRAARRPFPWRRVSAAGIAAVVAIGGLVAGLGYRAELRSAAVRGFEETHEGWDETITWLQSLDAEPTPEPPGSTSR